MPGRAFRACFFCGEGSFFTWIALPPPQLWHDFFTIGVEPALTAFIEATFTNESNHQVRRSLTSCLSPVGNAH
jgi:hypothetical protein